MKRQAPKIGQTLYSLNVGNAARNVEQKLTPVLVTAVGRKYFTCGKGWNEMQYHIDTWHEKTEFIARSRLYEKEQEYLDDKDRSAIIAILREAFSSYKSIPLTLDQLRRVMAIIEECA